MLNVAPGATRAGAIAGGVALAIFLVLGVVFFTGIYLLLPFDDHFFALIAIGILSLFMALGAYFAQAAVANPIVPSALSWGFTAMGLATLFLTILLNPGGEIATVALQLFLLVPVILVLLGVVVGSAWRIRAQASEKARLEGRQVWKTQPVQNALHYGTAGADVAPAGNAATAPQPPRSD